MKPATTKRTLCIITIAAVCISAVLLVQTCRNNSISSRNSSRAVYVQNISGRGWAKPVSLAGVPNLHKVSKNLYRGAQPTEEGFKNLRQLGVKTVINLRDWHSDKSKIADSNLVYEQVDMTAWHPEDGEVIRFLKIVSDDSKQPVFVHCLYGSDRTGTMCAIYRIAVEGWSKQEAIDEMTKGGFGFHPVWQNLVKYIEQLDVEKIKQEVKKP
jgi:protein tyrosine/serine phosphatase